jgi:hypothetical protein
MSTIVSYPGMRILAICVGLLLASSAFAQAQAASQPEKGLISKVCEFFLNPLNKTHPLPSSTETLRFALESTELLSGESTKLLLDITLLVRQLPFYAQRGDTTTAPETAKKILASWQKLSERFYALVIDLQDREMSLARLPEWPEQSYAIDYVRSKHKALRRQLGFILPHIKQLEVLAKTYKPTQQPQQVAYRLTHQTEIINRRRADRHPRESTEALRFAHETLETIRKNYVAIIVEINQHKEQAPAFFKTGDYLKAIDAAEPILARWEKMSDQINALSIELKGRELALRQLQPWPEQRYAIDYLQTKQKELHFYLETITEEIEPIELIDQNYILDSFGNSTCPIAELAPLYQDLQSISAAHAAHLWTLGSERMFLRKSS